jgi:Cu/Ag efflux pump CusA
VIGGIVSSTILTLLVLPIVLRALCRATAKIKDEALAA